MSELWWMAHCSQEMREDVERAVRQVEPEAKIVFARDAAALRDSLSQGDARSFAVVVAPGPVGVSDINLAAAIVRDGGARKVMLVGRKLSGSLRSRAARAGIDLVVDIEAKPVTVPYLREVPLDAKSVRGESAEEMSASACGEGHPNAGSLRTEEGGQSSSVPDGETIGDGPGSLFHPSSDDPTANAGLTAPVLIVGSGRGGVGKTTLAALSALVAASWGMRVALVDLDLGSGNLFTLFGIAHPPALDVGIRRERGFGGALKTAVPLSVPSVDELVGRGMRVAEGVTLWGPCERPELADALAPGVGPLLAHLAKNFDLVVVDASTTCTDAMAEAYQLCNRLLLVHDENLAAVGSLSRSASLAVRLGIARTQIVRIANWGDRRFRFDLSVGRNEMGLETARAFRLDDGGREVGELLAAGKAPELVSREMDPAPSVSRMLARILDDLGRLPASEEVHALTEEESDRGRRFQLFRRKAS